MREFFVGTESASDRTGRSSRAFTRRGWLQGALALLYPAIARPAWAQEPKRTPLRLEEQKVVGAVEASARQAGLRGFEARWTEHFMGIGNAPAAYRGDALSLCEMIAKDFVDHFRERKFQVALPANRMTVVLLKDVGDYAAFSGSSPEEREGGRYEVDVNRLVVFDFRPEQGQLAAVATRVNRFTLVHETIHLLCFNTGLLSAQADLPAAISEGLATYGELWGKTTRRKAFGMIHQPWLSAIDEADAKGIPRIPVQKLLANDRAFEDSEIVQLAYAESWLLVHMLLRHGDWLPKFRKYLAEMPKPGGKLNRVAYATSILGPLDKLDLAVRHYEAVVRRKRK